MRSASSFAPFEYKILHTFDPFCRQAYYWSQLVSIDSRQFSLIMDMRPCWQARTKVSSFDRTLLMDNFHYQDSCLVQEGIYR